MPTTPLYDLLIIGGGITGLSILRHATTTTNLNCILLESSPHLLSSASGSNSGIVCTGVDAPPDSLERTIIRDSIRHVRDYCRDYNVPMRECGSLICQWEEEEDDATSPSSSSSSTLHDVLKETRDGGDADATLLTKSTVLKWEPHLSPTARGAVHVPGEIVLDPWLFSVTFAVHARENGGVVRTHSKVESLSFDGTVWRCIDNKGRVVVARAIANAAGVHADAIQKSVGGLDRPTWESRPRRGQYRIFSGGDLLLRPIQPVPTPRTKGIFVYSSLYDQIVVGPTALDQESRVDRSVDPDVGVALMGYGRKVLPGLTTQRVLGEYVGIRPGTNHRDYQIRCHKEMNYVVAAGIRSTGLTASLGMGRYVVNLLKSFLDVTDKDPKDFKVCSPLPDVKDLVEEFHRSEDGDVTIGGFVYRVTHPITRIGWTERTGLAQAELANAKL